MRKRMQVFGTFVLVMLFGSIVSASTVVLSDDFEGAGPPGDAPADWEVLVDFDASVTVEDVSALSPPEGAYAVRMLDESYNLSAQFRREFGQTVAQGAVEYVVWVSPEKPAEAYVELRAEGAGKVLDCHVSGGGNFKCRSNGSLQTLADGLELGAWHTVRIEWETTTWTYRAYLNGADVTPEDDLNFDVQGIPSEINFKVGSNSKVGQMAYIDSLRITH